MSHMWSHEVTCCVRDSACHVRDSTTCHSTCYMFVESRSNLLSHEDIESNIESHVESQSNMLSHEHDESHVESRCYKQNCANFCFV